MPQSFAPTASTQQKPRGAGTKNHAPGRRGGQIGGSLLASTGGSFLAGAEEGMAWFRCPSANHRSPNDAVRCVENGKASVLGCRSPLLHVATPSALQESPPTWRTAGQLRTPKPSPRTTKLYDRTGHEITLDEVERVLIYQQHTAGRPRVHLEPPNRT